MTAISLKGADLRANLEGANMTGARLQGANCEGARLQGANLVDARLQGANLQFAELQGALLGKADLQGTRLSNSLLAGANLRSSALQGAELGGAILMGADLKDAQLVGADLDHAKLQGADLERANLEGADLRYAELQGARFGDTELRGADMRETHLWQARFEPKNAPGPDWIILPGETKLGLNDLRFANFSAVTSDHRASILNELGMFIADGVLRARTIDQVANSLAPQIDVVSAKLAQTGLVLIDSVLSDKWNDLLSDVTTNEMDYDAELAPFLLGLSKNNGRVAERISWRIIDNVYGEDERALYPNLARLLLQAREKGEVKLPDDIAEMLKPIAARAAASTTASAPPP